MTNVDQWTASQWPQIPFLPPPSSNYNDSIVDNDNEIPVGSSDVVMEAGPFRWEGGDPSVTLGGGFSDMCVQWMAPLCVDSIHSH